ncbi:hypothetical protein GY45DRAFT_1134156 [Cubamyces sp. BRFM 1775]|nr:hypothetical protein GY45DRAFT_1134156 [Cubamyces sp. BRFM 1775]
MSPSTALGPSPLSPSLLSHAASSPTSATALLPMAFDDAMVTPTALSPHVLSPAVTIPATSSPGDSTSTALSPAIASPIVASPATVPARRFRGAWDDPPPTPEYRPLSLQMNEKASFKETQLSGIASSETVEARSKGISCPSTAGTRGLSYWRI